MATHDINDIDRHEQKDIDKLKPYWYDHFDYETWKKDAQIIKAEWEKYREKVAPRDRKIAYNSVRGNLIERLDPFASDPYYKRAGCSITIEKDPPLHQYSLYFYDPLRDKACSCTFFQSGMDLRGSIEQEVWRLYDRCMKPSRAARFCSRSSTLKRFFYS